MALTVSILERGNFGNMNAVLGTIAFDSSYPTNGEALTPGDIGLPTIKFIIFEPTAGLTFEYDHTNEKVKAFAQGVTVGAAGAQTLDDFPVTAGVGVTADTHMSLKAGSATIGLGALKEVPSTNDLSSVTEVNFIAVGY